MNVWTRIYQALPCMFCGVATGSIIALSISDIVNIIARTNDYCNFITMSMQQARKEREDHADQLKSKIYEEGRALAYAEKADVEARGDNLEDYFY